MNFGTCRRPASIHFTLAFVAISLATAGGYPQTPSEAPAAISPKPRIAPDGTEIWDSGTYLYDGAGHVKRIGADVYVYDGVNRLVSGSARQGAGTQTYTYDAFGNRTGGVTTGPACLLGDCQRILPVNPARNRLTELVSGGSSEYDARGNLTTFESGHFYQWDALDVMTQQSDNGSSVQYIYDADDERIAIYKAPAIPGGIGTWKWEVRGPDGKVLREFSSTDGVNGKGTANLQWSRDYVYRDGRILASVEAGGAILHYHLDQLDTPRLVTDGSGSRVAEHDYYPFGAELTPLQPASSPEPGFRFTGHERDTIPGDLHTLDYMHARYFSASLARFVSTDPTLDIAEAALSPQKWNHYAYVQNDPSNAIDPDGRATYQVNRTLGGVSPGGVAITYVEQPISHTFIMTTSGGTHTYSWGNAPDGKSKGMWFKDRPEDMRAAREARKSAFITFVLTSERGDDSLDPYIEKAFAEHVKRQDRNHKNLWVVYNCKWESDQLVREAKELQKRDEEAKAKAKPTQKKVLAPGAARGGS